MLCFKKSYNSFGQQSSTRQLGKDKTNSFHFNFIAFCDFMLLWYLHLVLWRRVGKTCKTIFIEGEQRSFRESFFYQVLHKCSPFTLVLFVSSSEQVVTTIPKVPLLNNFGIWVTHTDLSRAISWVRGYRCILLLQLFHWLKTKYLLSTVFCVHIYMLSIWLQYFMYL